MIPVDCAAQALCSDDEVWLCYIDTDSECVEAVLLMVEQKRLGLSM